MRAPRNLLLGGALVLLTLIGCRDFAPKDPFPCSTAGRCPSGYTCDPVATLCHPTGKKLDGSSGDGSGAPDSGKDGRDGSNTDVVGADMSAEADGSAAGDINGEVSTDSSSDLPPLDLAADAVRTPNGGACTQGGECQSTFCVDNICCDKTCQGTCQACKQVDTGEPNGTCASVSAGRDPHDQCAQTAPDKCGDTGACNGQGACQKYGTNQVCAAAACGGAFFTPTGTCSGAGVCVPGTPINCMQYPCSAAAGCAKTCTGDGDCLGQSYCSNGTCAARKTSGQACSDKRECTSAFCIDGVCCDGACDGQCEACVATANGSTDGRCLPIPAGKLSASDCTVSGGACGQDGTCDGNRKCRVATRNTSCGSPSCSGNNLTAGPTCDGAGACTNTGAQACPGALICGSATACKTTCAIDGDCVGQTYCNNGSCAFKKNNGDGCTDKRECTSGSCADGVCCENACTGTCNACVMSLTSQPSGKCSAVKVGASHGNDCTSDGTSCGTDGKCDGKGACRFVSAATVCKGESCLPGTSTYSPMSTCDGKGACVAMPQDCDRYKCTSDGVRCRSSCGADGDCATKAYCNEGGLCISDLAPGAVCKRSEQCTSGTCVGRCCPAGSACNCPQPNAGNLLKNPGFDDNVSNWGTEGTFSRDSSDADACPYSGSLKVAGYPAQCVPVSGGTQYNLGFSYKHTTNEDEGPISCYLDFHDDFVCLGTAIGDNPTLGDFDSRGIVPWKSLSTTIAAPASARSAVVRCVVPGSWNLDKLFLTPAPGNY